MGRGSSNAWWRGDEPGNAEGAAGGGQDGHLAAVRRFAGLHRLSGQEAAVVAQAAEGWCMKEAATALGISVKTVESYWKRIYEKTGQTSQLAVMALIVRWTCAGHCPARQATPAPVQMGGRSSRDDR
jgi:DNA-binding CsgD family transcriptional regulator